jgi:hypothetical protein
VGEKKEYIERGALLDQMMFEMVGTGVQGRAMDVIRYALTADVVEVVRCKDCKHWGGATFGYICREWSGMTFRNYTKPDHYCSRGERKEQT